MPTREMVPMPNVGEGAATIAATATARRSKGVAQPQPGERPYPLRRTFPTSTVRPHGPHKRPPRVYVLGPTDARI